MTTGYRFAVTTGYVATPRFHDNGSSPSAGSTSPDSRLSRTIARPQRSADPLPSGHPVSWGAITRGTLLDGLPWPYRVESQLGEDRP